MARKKRVRRNVRTSRNLVRSNKRKINLVLKNLITFAVLFVLSLVLYMGSSPSKAGGLYTNLFAIFLIIFGFLAITFLIVLLIFVFMKALKK